MERTDFYTFVRVMDVSEKVRKCNCMQCFKGFLSVQADMRKADAVSNLLDFRKLSWLFFRFQFVGNQVENAGILVEFRYT